MISMKKVNYAAIDIGSNAVRLLIKCVNEENAPELMSKVQLIRIPLRLGEDVPVSMMAAISLLAA